MVSFLPHGALIDLILRRDEVMRNDAGLTFAAGEENTASKPRRGGK